MKQNTIEAIRAAHERLLARLEEETKRLEADLGKVPYGRKVPPDLVLKEKRTVLEREKQRLADLQTEKEAAMARLDAEIKQVETTVKRLEKELADDSKTLGGADLKKPSTGTRSAKDE